MSKVKVYFEGKGTAELVATFTDEETYIKCLPILEEEMKSRGWEFLTESMDEEEHEHVR